MKIIKRAPHPSGARHLQVRLMRWGSQFVVAIYNMVTNKHERTWVTEGGREGKQKAKAIFAFRAGDPARFEGGDWSTRVKKSDMPASEVVA